MLVSGTVMCADGPRGSDLNHGNFPNWEAWSNHLTDVLLALDGIAVVELPEAHADWHGGLSAWAAGDDGGEVTIRKSDGRIGYTSVLNPCESPAAARALAAALLAAADAAEQAAK